MPTALKDSIFKYFHFIKLQAAECIALLLNSYPQDISML